MLFVLPPECESFSHCGVVGFKILSVLDRGSYLHCGVVEFKPREGTCSIIFSTLLLLGSECLYVPRSVRMTYVTITINIKHKMAWWDNFSLVESKGTLPLRDINNPPIHVSGPSILTIIRQRRSTKYEIS